ncbi:hypothetical protein P691DRAFT_716315 [Macrolepiota fuliginosa MF-IS2]|uniref:Mid2 domain-containing protein n=1 Tax=Macrolepiota fuliginosa MF-IS2 TaxID=1400762 RepID=A0A9P5XQW6_9AGAR|nr:hypothetical protein P691DRAFT_716315 [Macrolepiota fuliginosa MF-IS2]
MFVILCWALLFAPLVAAFSFVAAPATECDSLSVSWSGGNGPFFLHLIPVFGTPRNISIPTNAFNNGQGSYSVSQFPMPAGEQYLLSMSDAAGFGTGGTTNLMTVGASKGGKCSTTDPGVDFSFQLNSALTQCRPYVFSGYSSAAQPVTIIGLIPSGNPIVLHSPTGATQFSWTTNVQHGTSILFMMVDALGRQGGTSDVRTVATSDDTTCLNAQSPSSTSALPATTPAGTSKSHSATSTGSAPSATSSQPSSGGTSMGAIAGTVIGALLFLAIIITLGLFFLRKRKEARQAPKAGFPPYDGSHNPHAYSLSSTSAFPATTPGPYTPQSPQSYNPQQAYGAQPYGHTYQPSAYAPSTYAPNTQNPTQAHNHTLSGGLAYDGYQGSMLPYDSNPFLDSPHHQQYPPSSYAHQSTYQLPSASAYVLPNPFDAVNTPMDDRNHPLPPPPPPVDDPFASSENVSTSDTLTSAQQRKAAMAGVPAYKSPSRILVHTDADDDVLPPPNADGVVELPPQYTERRGFAVVNQSPPSHTLDQSHFPSQNPPPASS